MKSIVNLRNEEPELFSKIIIMSQPSGNVDGVLNQAPAYILGHMTAQLQVTDTDCSRAWKGYFTHELDRGFSIGYPEIIRAATASQDYMAVLNEKTNWVVYQLVVSGAKRNGLRKDGPIKGEMGTSRIPADLCISTHWLDESGRPLTPDLIEWSNCHPEWNRLWPRAQIRRGLARYC